jgi:hypothetical protein
MVIVEMVGTRGCQTRAVWIGLEIDQETDRRPATIQVAIDGLWTQTQEILGGPLTAIGIVPDQSLHHDGPRTRHVIIKIALALEDLIKLVDCLVTLVCHRQGYQAIVGILQLLRNRYPCQLSGKNSSIPNELQLSRAPVHHHAQTRLGVTAMKAEIDLGLSLRGDTILKETTQTLDTTTDQIGTGHQMDTAQGLDKTMGKHHLSDLEATDLQIEMGSAVVPTEGAMHSSQLSLHLELSTRVTGD